jgi:hypothetical protein
VTAPAARLPVRRSWRMRVPAFAVALGVLAFVVVALSASTTHPHPAAARPAPDLNSLIHGAPLQRAHCTNWLAASPADRGVAVRALIATVGGPTEYRGVRGTALTPAESYALLDQACAAPVARHFLLYEIYIRAAGFRSAWATPSGS